MSDIIQVVNRPEEILRTAARLRGVALDSPIPPPAMLEVFERWAAALQGEDINPLAGAAFLRLWLRQATLEPILKRELGASFLNGDWQEDGRAQLRAFPLGIVGHWPAANIDIQPVLSMTCALLGGNACLVRVPGGLVDVTQELMAKLRTVDRAGLLTERIAFVSFDHARDDLHMAMASQVDGAMIWGSGEVVSKIRALPFPAWTRIATFGPRLSVAAMDADVWNEPLERPAWCQRMARDVWQFDQKACSSPQTLFLERAGAADVSEFVNELKGAFEAENRAHPRREINPALTSSICLARANWLLDNPEHQARFSGSPDWTILVGEGTDIPKPTQGRTLSVLVADDLMEAIAKFDGSVQTLGLAIGNPQREDALVQAAARRGVDRIVKLGRMHVFGSPWDGVDLIRPMVRIVRHVPSHERNSKRSQEQCV